MSSMPNLATAASTSVTTAERGSLRPVIIDGSNVAMQMGQKVFNTRGILICARYFIARGHPVLIFVPQYRRDQREDHSYKPMTGQYLLDWMCERRILIYTPSRVVQIGDRRKRIACYDDFAIVQHAHETGGVIVSKDQFRDVMAEHPEWIGTIQDRLIMFSWIGEKFMVAEDPLGRFGPRLNEILRFQGGEEVGTFGTPWTPEQLKILLKDIDDVLAAPPPSQESPPQPVFADALPSTSAFNGQGRTSIAELEALSAAPRRGFNRSGMFGFNHRHRRWMSEHRDIVPSYRDVRDGVGFNASSRQESSQPSQETVIDVPDDEDWDLAFEANESTQDLRNKSASDEGTDENGNRCTTTTLHNFFGEMFPSEVVAKILTEYKNVDSIEILANLMMDAVVLRETSK